MEDSQMSLVVFAGRKGSGKSELSKFLINNYDFKKISFADPLKRILSELYNWDLKDLYSQEGKEKELSSPVKWDEEACNHLNKILKSNFPYNNKNIEFKTRRQALQYIGTDFLRNIDENFHCKQMTEFLSKNNGKFVIDDLRFKNELDVIKNFPNIAVFIVRPSNFDYSNHESEIDLTVDQFDNVIINDISKKSFIKKFGFFYRYQIKKQFKNKKINLIGSDKKMFYDLLTKFDFDTTKVADFLGCSRDAVVWWTNANLITLRRNKYKLNNQVFQKANEESAYWAGVISADGCIKEIGKSKNRMLLELTSTDKILIDKFKEFMCTDKPIYEKNRKGRKKQYYISLEDPILIDSLKLWCIEPRKSKKNKIN